jgi:hypothetical protein
VVWILASLVPPNFGREQENVVRSLLGCLLLIDEPSPSLNVAVADALASYAGVGQTLPPEALVRALDVALAASRPALVEAILDDEHLLEASERVTHVATRLDRLPAYREQIEAKVVEFFPEDRDVLLEPLETLPESAATQLLRATFEQTIGKVVVAETGEAVQEMAARLFDSLDGDGEDRSEFVATAQDLLLGLEAPDAYAVVQNYAPRVCALQPNQRFATRDALRAFAQAPPAQWEEWLSLAEEYELKDRGDHDEIAGVAVASIFKRFDEADESEQEAAAEIVRRVTKLAPLNSDEAMQEVFVAVEESLGASSNWATDAEAAKRQARLHAAGWAAEVVPVDTALEADLDGAITVPPPTARLVDIAKTAQSAPSPVIASVTGKLAQRPDSDNEQSLMARIWLARAVAQRDDFDLDAVDVFEFDPKEVAAIAAAGQTAALRNWLVTDPPVADVYVASLELQSLPVGERSKVAGLFAEWGETKMAEERTQLLLPLLSLEHSSAPWLEPFASQELDEVELVKRLVQLEASSTRHPQRQLLADALGALRPRSPAAQRQSADFVIALLKRRTAADFATALDVVGAIGTAHQRKSRLEKEFKAASEETKKKVPAKYVGDLAAAGLELPKKYVAEPKKGLRKRLTGR